jgi:hypothetical protein
VRTTTTTAAAATTTTTHAHDAVVVTHEVVELNALGLAVGTVEAGPGVVVPQQAVANAGDEEGDHCLGVELHELDRHVAEVQEAVLELAAAEAGTGMCWWWLVGSRFLAFRRWAGVLVCGCGVVFVRGLTCVGGGDGRGEQKERESNE